MSKIFLYDSVKFFLEKDLPETILFSLNFLNKKIFFKTGKIVLVADSSFGGFQAMGLLK